MKQVWGVSLVLISGIFLAALVYAPIASAAAIQIQNLNSVTNGGTSVTVNFGVTATANNLLIVICGARDNATITGPAGFSTAINQAGTPSQGIFYKVAVGNETSATCDTGAVTTRLGIQFFEYSGIQPANPFGVANSVASTGTGTAVSSGSITTTATESLLIAGLTTQANTSFSGYSNTFVEEYDFSNGGQNSTRTTYGGASRSVLSAGTYTTTGTALASGAWRGQIVSFNLILGALGVDIVNAAGATVASPSVGMAARTFGFDCQTSTGTLGVSAERIRVSNTTTTPQWTVAIAATAGATGNWSSGANTFDFNDSSGAPAGCADGADADTIAGRMTIDPSVGTTTPQTGCSTTGVTRGASTSFVQGTTNSITVISASNLASTSCYWDLINVAVSQTIPVQQAAGTYVINLTLTVTAT